MKSKERFKVFIGSNRSPTRKWILSASPCRLALRVACSMASVWASDISQGAIEQATLNANRHGLADRIHFLVGDLFEPVKNLNLSFDFILTNPPYVASEDFDSLPLEIKHFEPRIALDGHQGGMFYIKKILRQAPVFLKPGGWLMMEMDTRQISSAKVLLKEMNQFGETRSIQDYSRKERILMTQKT